jgi:hypothetical protein
MPASQASARLALEVVCHNTHLNHFQPNHYDPQE